MVSDAVRRHQCVEPKKTPEEGYHLMEDMTDKAMAWVSQQKALAPDKPFFVYFAPAATTLRITCPRNGPTNTWANLTKAGTNCVKKPSFGKRSLG